MGKKADRSPPPTPPPQLRVRAEAELARATPAEPPTRSAEELLHELRVYQIELEMQNENLRQSLVALEQSRDCYTDLYDFAPIGYLTLTPDGLISQINLAGAAQLQMPREKLIRRRFASFVAAEDRDRWHRHFSNAKRHSAQGAAELALQRGDGTVFHAQIDYVRHQAVADETAMAPEIRMAVTDITPRKAAERALAEAMDAANGASLAKSAFLANMSHEMRTPLHVIIGLVHLLRRDLIDSTQRERVDQLCRTSDHLLGVVNDVLDLSKIEARQFVLDQSDFRLDTMVGTVRRMVEARAQEKGLSLAVDVDPRVREMPLRGDALRLAQVLINLCGNAIKFTDAGEVQVRIGCVAEGSESATLHFVVKDSGIGIPRAEQARVFRSFEQIGSSSAARDHEGTGLGLAISQHLVTMMGGTIRVDSEPGKGSTFSFALVLLRAAEHVSNEEVPASALASFPGMRVLIAEDHPIGQEILFEMLEDLGCLVDVASDGAEAVACAREQCYDVILMDMQMPGMDGLAATRAIRRIPGHRDTPIIALTANAFVEDRQRCIDAGMNGHVGKPVTPAALAATLGQWQPAPAVSDDDEALCENELTRALADTPGLTVGSSWRRSPEGVADYRAQLARFIDMHGMDAVRLRENVIAGEYATAQVLAHDLKGIAGLMGADRIASQAGQIEDAVRRRVGKAQVAALIAGCEAELTQLGEAIRILPAS